jgi:predicted Zn-dependent protease
VPLLPDPGFPQRGLGVVLAAQARMAEAEEVYRQAVVSTATDRMLYLDLADALDALGRGDEAAQCDLLARVGHLPIPIWFTASARGLQRVATERARTAAERLADVGEDPPSS